MKIKNRQQNNSLSKDETITRRSFLDRAWKWLGVIATLEFAGLTFSFLSSDGKKRKPLETDLRTLGKVKNFKAGTVTPFRGSRFYLVRLKDGGFMALSLKCTHLGCSVDWVPTKDEFVCPCHASIYNMEGVVVRSPAPRPLSIYKVIIEGGLVKVDLSNAIRRKFFDSRQVVYA